MTGAVLPGAVVLFGASGFVGRNIVQALQGRGPRIIGVTQSGRAVPGCERVVASSEVDALPQLPAGSAIINVASRRYDARSFAIDQARIVSENVGLVNQVYSFALDRGITEVRAASSSAVYPASWPLQDDALPLPLDDWPHLGEAAYAWSKRWGEIAGELWRRRAGVNTISFRLSNPYGPFDTLDDKAGHVATSFVIRALREDGPFLVRGDPDAERDFVYAGDVAEAFVNSLELKGVQAAVNCAAGTTTRIRDLADVAIRASGRDRTVEIVPPPPGANAGVKVRRATAARLREVLPDLPQFRSLEEGMRLTLDWYRDALR